MNVLCAVYGTHTQAVVARIGEYCDGLKHKSGLEFVPTYYAEQCVLGKVTALPAQFAATQFAATPFAATPFAAAPFAATQCATAQVPAHAPTHNSLTPAANPLALLLQSRMSVNALLQCNLDSLGCKSLNDLSAYLQQASHSNDSQSNLHTAFAALDGDFTCIFANEAENSLVLAVSAFNPQTLFYACLPEYENTYVVCSDVSVLLDLVPPQVDTGALAMWLAGRPDPNRSMFANIHQVPQAGMLSLCMQQGKVKRRLEKFWDITPQRISELKGALAGLEHEQLVSKLHAHLRASVELNLQTGSCDALQAGPLPSHAQVSNHGLPEQSPVVTQAPVCARPPIFTQLSGGMDSTSVSALAFDALNAGADTRADAADNTGVNKHPLHSISHTYANTQSCDETDNIQAMIARYGFAQSHFIELDKYTDLSFAELYPTHPQSPGMVLSPKYHEEAKLLKAFGSKLLLTGNGGDEMFWGHSFAYYDRLKSGDITVVGEVMRGAKALNLSTWQSLKSVFLSPMLHYDILPMLHFASKANARVERSLHIPPWLTEQSEAMVREHQYAMANANPFASSKHDLTRYARYEGLFNTSTFNSMRSYQAVFDQYGLQVQHPLFNKHIAEFSFAVDQHCHISGKYPKLLLRQAMSEQLPQQVCWNTHKTVFDQHFAKLVQENQQALRKLLEHEGLAELGLVDNQKLLASFDALVTAKQPSLNVDLLYAILVQSWYQTHILKLNVH